MAVRRGVRTRNLGGNCSKGNRSKSYRSAGQGERDNNRSGDRSRGVRGIRSVCFPPFPPFGSTDCRSPGRRRDKSRVDCECDGIE